MPEPYAERPDPDLITTRTDFARALSRLRERAGLTVRDVARAVGTRDSTAGGYFSGRHLPGPRSQSLLAGILRVCGVDDPAEVDRWVAALVRVRHSPGPRPAGEPAPYRGLATFEPEDERWFHGRDALTRLLVDRVRTARTPLVVTGPSGSGKSSLLRAGLVPVLRRERRPDGSPVWDCRVLVPGEQPLRRLAAEPPAAPGSTLVLVLDQFEEVFTLGRDPRESVVEAVTGLAAGARVVLGLRADFWAAAAAQPALVPALQDGQVVVGPMPPGDLRRAITEPARLAALELQDGLVEVILRDAAPRGDAGTLPLLSHALLATWRRGQRGRLTVADYLDSGGIAGAIAQTAESIYLTLAPDEQELARRLFLRLVHVDDDAADTRRRVPRAELEDAGLLDRYVEQRLVTVDASTAEIAHEALLSAWPRLREWVDADRAGLRVHRRLTDAARVWQQADRDPHALLRGGRLAAAAEWAADPDHHRALNQAEREFLAASIGAEEADRSSERRRARRLRTLLACSCALLLIAAGLTGYLVRQRSVAEVQRDQAISRRVATDADRLRDVDRNLSTQLALAAYRIAPTAEARSSLVDSSSVPEPTRLLGPDGVLQAVTVTPDGRTVAAGGADGRVRLWDRAGRRLLGTVLGSAGPSATVFAVAVSPDGRTLATGGSDGKVRLWSLADPAHPRQVGEVVGSTGPLPTVFAIAFSPDGSTLAAGGADKLVRLWPLADLVRTPAILGGPRDYVQALAFSPDGTSLAAGSADGDAYRWDLRRHTAQTLTGASGMVFAVAFSPDGRTLAGGSFDKAVHLWSVPSGRPLPSLAGSTSWVNGVAFSPDGRLLAAAGSDSMVRLWSLPDHRPAGTLPHPGPVTAVRFADDGRTLATSAADGAVRLWPLPRLLLARLPDSVFSVQFTGGGTRLAVAGGRADDTVRTWDVGDPRMPRPDGPVLRGPAAAPFTGAMVVSPDGGTVATGSIDGSVRLWRGGVPTLLHGPGDIVQSLAFSRDGRILAASGNDRRVWVWRLADPSRPVALVGSDNTTYGVTFDPTGRYVAAGSSDDHVRIWDLTGSTEPITTLGGPASYVYSVAFSPDGSRLAAGSADSDVWLWALDDIRRPTPEPPLSGPGNYVNGVTFDRSGTVLAATGGDRTLWAWTLARTGPPRLLLRLTSASEAVLSADFRPDGTWLAAGLNDGTVRLWNLDPEQVAGHVCATAGDPLSRAEWDRYVTGAPYRPPC